MEATRAGMILRQGLGVARITSACEIVQWSGNPALSWGKVFWDSGTFLRFFGSVAIVCNASLGFCAGSRHLSLQSTASDEFWSNRRLGLPVRAKHHYRRIVGVGQQETTSARHVARTGGDSRSETGRDETGVEACHPGSRFSGGTKDLPLVVFIGDPSHG